ncbi:PLP-dependent transferase [Thozetella sp. PMI_491]|nr:PLP-dependent transferase [Thozetella sp. PMI_491]
MDATQFREAAHAAIEQIIDYYSTIQDRRVVSSVSPGYLRLLLPDHAPQNGECWAEIQPDIERCIMDGLTHWNHPNFMAYFPANSSYAGILGELYSAAFTAPAFNWLCSPAITELETIVMDWVCKLLSLPECYLSCGEGGGVIQGSTSEAVATVMVAARERMVRRATRGLSGEEAERKEDEVRRKLIALASDQAHSCTQKGAIIAGTKFRTITTQEEGNFSLNGSNLKKMLEDCCSKGLLPYYLTVNLGATNTCAVDNFEEIAQVLEGWPEVWVHVEGAFAGAALTCPEYQHLSKDFGRFNSFGFNMHKWLLTNFDASCLFVKTRSDLTSALSVTPSYLRNEFSDSGLVTDYRDWQIPLGRRFRSLKVWFVLRSYGISGLQSHIRGHIRLGELFHSLVASRPDLFRVIAGPIFALTVLAVIPARGQMIEDANALTKNVYDLINKRGEIFLTSTVVGGTYAIRVVSGSPNSAETNIRRAFDILVETTEEVLGRSV